MGRENGEEGLSDLVRMEGRYESWRGGGGGVREEIKDKIGFWVKKNGVKIGRGVGKEGMLKKDMEEFVLCEG